MKSQDYKEQHKVTCKGFIDAGVELVAFACDCGRMWLRDAIDAPFTTSIVACKCGAKAGFDLRTTRQRKLDAGGAP